MNITKDMMVTLSYTLKADEKGGEIIEQTTSENPLKFIFGNGLMLPEFEKNLEGLKQDDLFSMQISAANGYGEIDNEAVVDLPKDIFFVDGIFDEERFLPGSTIPMQTSAGQRMNGTVLEINEDTIKMDFNHPLAGVDLHFEGKIIDVRQATEDELNEIFGGCGCGSSCGSDCGSDCGSSESDNGGGSCGCGCN